jgi:hypothetical protein
LDSKVEGNRDFEAYRHHHRRMVANYQAVARANAYVASKVNRSGGRARNREGEGSMTHRNLIDAMDHSSVVEATAWWTCLNWSV